MTQAIGEFLRSLFGDNAALATIIISIIPLIELKGAIPFGVSPSFWGEHALTSFQAFLCSILGGAFVTIVLAFIFKPIYNALKDKKFFKSIINFFTASIKKKTSQFDETGEKREEASESGESTENQLENKKDDKKTLWKKILIVFGFVAIPVPGTGVYTGTALAILLGLNPLISIVTVTLGNILAGVIIMTICAVFPAFSTILFYIFIVLILALLIYKIIVHFVNKKNEKESV